jgi:hypothetical protein
MLVRVLVVLALLTGATPAVARRVALIIANAQYANAPMLTNPLADAKLIEASLRRAGFDNIQTRTNLGKAAVEAELRAFGNLATTLEGDWYGNVISDSKGSSRSDVMVTIRRTSRNTIAITSDYARLPAVTVKLTRAMQTILAAEGNTTIYFDTAKEVKELGIVFEGTVAWSGVRGGSN